MQRFQKVFPYLLVVIFIAWASYKFIEAKKNAPQVEEQTMALDWNELGKEQGTAKNPKLPQTLARDGINKRVTENKHSELSKIDEDNFKAFDEMEEKWLKKVESLFTPVEYRNYLEMRKRNEQEKMVAYKEYHDYLRSTQGDAFSYKISEDQTAREKLINQDYLKELLNLVGEEKFKKFVAERDKMNEQLRKEGKEFIQVEF